MQDQPQTSKQVKETLTLNQTSNLARFDERTPLQFRNQQSYKKARTSKVENFEIQLLVGANSTVQSSTKSTIDS